MLISPRGKLEMWMHRWCRHLNRLHWEQKKTCKMNVPRAHTFFKQIYTIESPQRSRGETNQIERKKKKKKEEKMKIRSTSFKENN